MMFFTKEYRNAFAIALSVHLIVLGLLFFSMDVAVHTELPGTAGSGGSATSTPNAVPSLPGIAPAVDAVMVDGAKLDAEVKRLQNAEQQKQLQAVEQQKQLQRTKEERRQEEVRLQQLKKDAEKALALAAKQKKEEEVELAKMKSEQEKLQKELKSLKEQKKKDAMREQEEAVRKVEEDKERKRLTTTDKDTAQKKTLENNQSQANTGVHSGSGVGPGNGGSGTGTAQSGSGSGQSAVTTEMQRISLLIHDKIQSHKQRIPGLPPELTTVLKFRILPDGTVLGVKVVESSGNTAYDNVSVNAVLKASPLPVSPDPAVMSQLQDVTLKVKNDD